MTSHSARVALIGLGPIGIEVGKALASRDEITTMQLMPVFVTLAGSSMIPSEE